MRTVLKYPLDISKRQTIKTHVGAMPVLVDSQDGILTLWLQVETDLHMFEKHIIIVKTGTDVSLGTKYPYQDFLGSTIIGKNVLFLYEDSE